MFLEFAFFLSRRETIWWFCNPASVPTCS